MLYCKQMTYESLMCTDERVFDAKRGQIGAKNGQEPPFMRLLYRGLLAKKAPACQHNGGARRASSSTLSVVKELNRGQIHAL